MAQIIPSFCCSQGQIREDRSFSWKRSISASSLRWSAKSRRFWPEEKQIIINTQIEPELFASVDETFYIRMLVNLISNAICYGNEGGHILVSCFRQNGFITGSVEDDGIGISAEDLPHIWDRVLPGRYLRSASGHSGLGLSMVKWIIEAHGGTFTAESIPGKGTIFTFLLPGRKKINFCFPLMFL